MSRYIFDDPRSAYISQTFYRQGDPISGDHLALARKVGLKVAEVVVEAIIDEIVEELPHLIAEFQDITALAYHDLRRLAVEQGYDGDAWSKTALLEYLNPRGKVVLTDLRGKS